MASTQGGTQRNAYYRAHAEKIRFVLVGAMNTLLGYGLFLLLLAVLSPLETLSTSRSALVAAVGHNYYVLVQWLAWLIAVPLSTYSFKRFVFKSTGNLLKETVRAFFVYLPAQGINSAVLWATVVFAGLPPQIGQLATIAVGTTFSYFGHKYFTFRTQRRRS